MITLIIWTACIISLQELIEKEESIWLKIYMYVMAPVLILASLINTCGEIYEYFKNKNKEQKDE